jgi:hypothetical protein
MKRERTRRPNPNYSDSTDNLGDRKRAMFESFMGKQFGKKIVKERLFNLS